MFWTACNCITAPGASVSLARIRLETEDSKDPWYVMRLQHSYIHTYINTIVNDHRLGKFTLYLPACPRDSTGSTSTTMAENLDFKLEVVSVPLLAFGVIIFFLV